MIVAKTQKNYKGVSPVKANQSRKFTMKKITGQGMSEYLVIVGLLAVAGIAAMGFMGGSIRSSMAAFAQEMAGGGNTAAIQADAQADADQSNDLSTAGLGDYVDNNDQL